VAQYEERTAPARHPGGRDGERSRGYVERPATLSSAPQASPPRQLLLSLQRTAGNRAVRGLIQRLREESGQARLPHAALSSRRVIQRALWENMPADFQTDNETGGKIPNSEYSVVETSFRRYAPINEIRREAQVYQEGDRSVAYIKGRVNDAADKTESVRVDDGKIFLQKGEQKLEAVRKPQTGLTVWDGKVDSNGKVGDDVHVGHAVQKLGGKLPTLGDARKLQKVRAGQKFLIAAQKAFSVPFDQDLWELKRDLMAKRKKDRQPITEEQAIAEMKEDKDIGLALREARRGKKEVEFAVFDRLKNARARLLGKTSGSDDPATETGIDPAGEWAGATTDGGPKPPEDTGQSLDEMLGAPQPPLATEHGRDQPAEDATGDGGPELPQGALADLSWLDDPIWGGLDAGESPESQASSDT
jgi:hypothetical protein